MIILRKGFQGIAIIDHSKAYGEEGQYVSHQGNDPAQFISIIATARVQGLEIRYYYKDLKTSGGEVIPTKIIVTEIPPLTVQQFHTHETVHEISVVDKGEIVVIDSDDLQEADADQIFQQGSPLCQGDMVIEDPGTRHTVANRTREYAVFTTVQTARIPYDEFKADWVK